MILSSSILSILAVTILQILVVFPLEVYSWLPVNSIQSLSGKQQLSFRQKASLCMSNDENIEKADGSTNTIPDYSGKTIYQRTFYRLSPGSQVEIPNAIMIEERLRFHSDPNNPEYILPIGPRTFILREGTDQDELTDALFTIDVLQHQDGQRKPHNGPRSMDTEIATILYLASNPKWIQGDVLELSCSGTAGASGIVGILGCIAAKFVLMSKEERKRHKQQLAQTESQEDIVDDIMTVPKHDSSLFPQKMHHLTLSDESPEAIQGAFEMVKKHFSPKQVSLKELEWSIPRRTGTNRRYDHEYRTIIGSDLELTYPTARELARTVANMLLPSNEFAVANIKEGATTAPSFGALGMDPEPSSTSYKEPIQEEVNSSIPAIFVHLCPDYRDEVTYLRQFLEKGFLMTVTSSYVKMQRLQFVFQTLPKDSPEEELEALDSLELQEETARDYQSLTAIHHPEYAGEGSGEYFFPLETGAYEGGMSSTFMEPESGYEM